MFAAFMKRWTLVIAIICAVCAIKNIVERDWLMAMWNVALTGLNHLAYDSWTKQEKEDEQRKNQKDR